MFKGKLGHLARKPIVTLNEPEALPNPKKRVMKTNVIGCCRSDKGYHVGSRLSTREAKSK
jgi:hypothetical protein